MTDLRVQSLEVQDRLDAKKANTTAVNGQVNKLIPISWDTKAEVIAMRLKSMTTPKK